jgi:hypothetical protein
MKFIPAKRSHVGRRLVVFLGKRYLWIFGLLTVCLFIAGVDMAIRERVAITLFFTLILPVDGEYILTGVKTVYVEQDES